MIHRYDHRSETRGGEKSRSSNRREVGTGRSAGAGHESSHGVPRFLRESHSSRGASRDPVTIQRDGNGPLPPTGFQLTPPSMLQPSDPYARYMPDFGFDLQIDPEIQAQIRVIMAARAREMMRADHVIASVRPLLPPIFIPLPGGATAPVPVPATTASLPPLPSASSSPSPDAPVSPEPTRAGSGGDVLGAVLALPRVRAMLDGIKSDFTGGLSTYWAGASTFDRSAFVTGSVVVSSSVIGSIVGFEGPRNFVLPLLNDIVVPVPGLPGYGLEMNFSPDSIMIGAHLDVGQFFPPLFGFGAASFEAIGGPPQPLPSFPISPTTDGSGGPGGSTSEIARGLAHRSHRGVPLDAATRRWFETESGQALPEVRLHLDPQADRLATTLGARAFTTGRDIFFRSGEYAPERPDGRRLLSHELAHVPQQERGISHGRDIGHGIRVTEPGDAHEREADRIAARLSRP